MKAYSEIHESTQYNMKGIIPHHGLYQTLARLLETSMAVLYEYSKTSNNGPSEKRTTSLQRTAHLPPIDFTIELNLREADNLSTADGSLAPD